MVEKTTFVLHNEAAKPAKTGRGEGDEGSALA
jgi:hypothetical protein